MGEDRLDQRERVSRHDMLCCWPFKRDFNLADAAKRADNLVTARIEGASRKVPERV
jgi:hypothetical protein